VVFYDNFIYQIQFFEYTLINAIQNRRGNVMTEEKLTSLLNQDHYELENIIALLSITDPSLYKLLQKKAHEVQQPIFHNTVYYRGLIEFSNICIKNCLYCGIRKDNPNVSRYEMPLDEILSCVEWNYKNDYGSITIQSGERTDEAFIYFVETVLKESKKITNNEIGITVSCGEQTYETYERWFKAGADRYLLRIETSKKELYEQIHPQDSLHQFENRVQCLKNLRKIGYQVGTGVMIGLPNQTIEDLAKDILFFKEIGAHMIGMGPYITHSETPLGQIALNSSEEIKRRFQLGLNMIAVTRIMLPYVNIAATTALQALDPIGREKGVEAGANILMPITTSQKHRKNYLLYDNKPCVEDTSDDCKKCLMGRMFFIDKKIGFKQQGNSPLYQKEREFLR
jgi:biotin synthase